MSPDNNCHLPKKLSRCNPQYSPRSPKKNCRDAKESTNWLMSTCLGSPIQHIPPPYKYQKKNTSANENRNSITNTIYGCCPCVTPPSVLHPDIPQ